MSPTHTNPAPYLFHSLAYLEINQRVDVLNARMGVIGDLLDMLKEHLTTSHGEFLEWIIIVLIAIEILMGLIEICIMLFYSHSKV
jgi:uncharacterized Rmd1/YagE family protein